MNREQHVWIDCTNWRGERSVRQITPIYMEFITTSWHPERQWILRALDVEKNDFRLFALKDIHEWRTEPPHDHAERALEQYVSDLLDVFHRRATYPDATRSELRNASHGILAALRAAEQRPDQRQLFETGWPLERAITKAMSWQPSENGPSYEETRWEVEVVMKAALGLERAAEQRAPLPHDEVLLQKIDALQEQPAPEKEETDEAPSFGVTLAPDDFDEMVRRLQKPSPPTPANIRGAKLLEAYRRQSERPVPDETVRQPSHPADAGSGEDAQKIEELITYHRDKARRLRSPGDTSEAAMMEERTARVLRALSSELSAAREQIADLDREWKRSNQIIRDYAERCEEVKAEREALSQEVARAYEECAKIAEEYQGEPESVHSAQKNIAAAIRAASLARGG